MLFMNQLNGKITDLLGYFMLIRLCYASQYQNTELGLLEDLRAILVTAREFNAEHEICGVLYYAKEHFFQCLEGEEQQVKAIYEKICMDTRHTVMKCFEIENIQQCRFSQWSMKYVKPDTAISKFFKKQDILGFKPQNLVQQQLPEFIHLLLQADSLSINKTKQGKYRGYQNYF